MQPKNTNEWVEEYWNTITPKDIKITTQEDNDKFLIERFGEDKFQEFIRKYKQYINPENERQRIEFVSFIQQTGMYPYVRPEMMMMKKEVLKSIKNYLNTKEDIELLDLGCEDGRITLGLHLGLENISKTTGIDYSGAAINNMKKNVKKLEEKYGGIHDLVMKKESFTDKEFAHERGEKPLGMLFLFPSYSTDTIIKVIRKISPNFTIISKNMYHLDDTIAEKNIENILRHVNTSCYGHHIKCTSIDYKRITDKEAVFIGVIQP